MNKLGKFEKISDVYCCVLLHKLDLIWLAVTLTNNSEKTATNWEDEMKLKPLILIKKNTHVQPRLALLVWILIWKMG